MQAALAVLSRLAPSLYTPAGQQDKGVSSLLKELVLNQEKTMFYTVTVSPASPAGKDNKLRLSPGLKWQCACALSKSQSVISRTNTNSHLYYTLTFLSEPEDGGGGAVDDLMVGLAAAGEGKEVKSPVRLYIRS